MRHKKMSNPNFIYRWNGIYIVIDTCVDEAKELIWYQCDLIITHDSQRTGTIAHKETGFLHEENEVQMFVDYLHYCLTTPFAAEMCEHAFNNMHDVPALVRKRYILGSF